MEEQKTAKRTKTVYDKRPDGWRYLRTEEVEVPCAPSTQSLRELRRSKKHQQTESK